MWLTFESGSLVLSVYIDLVVVSLEMLFVIRDAILHSVSLMEEIEINCQPPSVVQCVYFPFVCMYCGHVYKVYSSHPMSPCSNVSSAPPLCSLSPR